MAEARPPTAQISIFCGFRYEYSGRWVAHGRVDERAACRSLQVTCGFACKARLQIDRKLLQMG